MEDNDFDFKAWEERHREILNELVLPFGLLVALVIACWIASQ